MSEFVDYSGGFPISNIEINRWLDGCRKHLIEGRSSYFISSGDTVVTAFLLESEDEVHYLFQVCNDSGFQELTLEPLEIDEFQFNYGRKFR